MVDLFPCFSKYPQPGDSFRRPQERTGVLVDIGLSPELELRKVEPGYRQLILSSKSRFLRDRLRLIRQSGMASSETAYQSENWVNAINQETNPIGQWNAYKLGYEGCIPVAEQQDLLGLVLDLRTRANVLDGPHQEVWSGSKLEQMEQDLRLDHADSGLRVEIASFARAIHECDVQKRRDIVVWEMDG